MGATEFLKKRFIRLYPMLFVGATGGVALAIIHNYTNPADAYPMSSILVSGALSVFVLPYLGTGIPGNKAFSFNPPIWSLFFEIIVNISYSIFRRWLNVSVLLVVILASLITIGFLGPLDGGSKENLAYGIPRVVAGFFAGVLLYKLWAEGRLPTLRGNLVILSIVIIAIFAIPYPIGGWAYIPTFFVLCLTVLAAANAAPSRMDRFSGFLGEASYPVYLVHWLTLYVATFIGNRIGLTGAAYHWVVIAHLVAIPFIGFALFHLYEKPAMAWLRRVLLVRS